MLDPRVAALLVSGDDIGWVAPPSVEAAAALHASVIAALGDVSEVLTESDGGIISDPEECLAQEERLEQRVAALKRKEGLASDRTLKQAFKLMDCLSRRLSLSR